MRSTSAIILILLTLTAPIFAADKPRLIVLTDIGGDPDDQQSMIRLMVYANEFDIEALIASASGTQGELKEDLTRPDLIRQIVEAYGQVHGNLIKHDPNYPAAKTLLDRIHSGNPKRGVEQLGEGRDTEGSKRIIAILQKDDDRPVHITIWGGSTDLAQALWWMRKHLPERDARKLMAKLRIYDISHQDNTGEWINKEFPDLFYVLAMAAPGRDKREGAYRGMYLGGDESLTSRQWVDGHILLNHGPLGALYPTRTWTAPNKHSTMKEGDTPSWLFFLPNGLNDQEHPDWGGWGGRFTNTSSGGGGLWRDAKDTIGDASEGRVSVWRWRPYFAADFAARMDWCVQPFDKANHAPVAAIGDDRTRNVMMKEVKAGDTLTLSAAESRDPDRGQTLKYKWWIYDEAGTYRGRVELKGADRPAVSLVAPSDARGKTLHLILEVTDDGEPALTAFRRVIVKVE